MRTKALSGALGAVFLMLASTAGFTAELGRVEFQGKTIILFDDGAWRHADALATKAPACEPQSKLTSAVLPLSMCFDRNVWSKDEASGAWEMMFQSKQRNLYGGFIPERFALNETFLRKAILDNAAGVAEGGVSAVKVREESKVVVNGRTWNRLVYDVPMEGLSLVYVNYFGKLGTEGAVQVVFFTTASAFESVLPLIESTAASIEVGLPAEPSVDTSTADRS